MKLIFENKELLSMGEAANKLGVSRMTLHRWANAGKINAIQVGAYRAIPASEVERINNGKAE